MNPIVSPASESLRTPAPNPPLHPQKQLGSIRHDFFALSIAVTSDAGANLGAAMLSDALAVVKVFRDDFKVHFNQHMVCSDAPGTKDAGFTTAVVRNASLSDIQSALLDILRAMISSRDAGKQLSLLVHLNMKLSSLDNTSANDSSAGSSDGLVAPRSFNWFDRSFLMTFLFCRCCIPATPCPTEQ
jgi:hypothetical protein